MQFSPLPCYPVPIRPKYSPRDPILKHPQPTLLPQRERPSFTKQTKLQFFFMSSYILNTLYFIHFMYSVKSRAQLLSDRYIHHRSFASYGTEYEETWFRERFKAFWRVWQIACGIGACEIVFVLVKRSALCIAHATTSHILFTYNQPLIRYAVFVLQSRQMLFLCLVSDDPFLSFFLGMSTEASHKRFCLKSNSTDATHSRFRWPSPFVVTVLS